VRITYVVGNSVSEEYSKLSEDEVVYSVRTVCIPDCLVLVCRETISMLFGVENEVMKWRCRIRYEIAFGSYVFPHSTLILHILHFLTALVFILGSENDGEHSEELNF